MTRPSLLFVSTRFLFPNDSGGKIRTTQILRGMKGGRFRIVLASPADDAEVARYRDELDSVADAFVGWPRPDTSSLGWRLRRVAALAARAPVSVVSDFSPAGARCVADQLARQPDLVVLDFPHAAILAPSTADVRSVIFTHNVEAEIFRRHRDVATNPLRRALWSNQYRKMLRFEREVLNRVNRSIAVSDRDARHFADHYGVASVDVIPTGVDLDFFTYGPPQDNKTVVFVGSMDWMANIDGVEFFLDAVWDKLRQRVPGVKMRVVGRAPPRSLVEKAAGRDWDFTGFVDDIRPHVVGAAACVIPLRVGGGTRIKAYEAMAMGVPVVSTAIGVEGLPVVDGEHYLRADTPEEMVTALASVLSDAERRSRLSQQARALVEANFSSRRVAEVFERICGSVLAETARQDASARPAPVAGG